MSVLLDTLDTSLSARINICDLFFKFVFHPFYSSLVRAKPYQDVLSPYIQEVFGNIIFGILGDNVIPKTRIRSVFSGSFKRYPNEDSGSLHSPRGSVSLWNGLRELFPSRFGVSLKFPSFCRCYTKALQTDPSNGSTFYKLGHQYITKKDNLTEMYYYVLSLHRPSSCQYAKDSIKMIYASVEKYISNPHVFSNSTNKHEVWLDFDCTTLFRNFNSEIDFPLSCTNAKNLFNSLISIFVTMQSSLDQKIDIESLPRRCEVFLATLKTFLTMEQPDCLTCHKMLIIWARNIHAFQKSPLESKISSFIDGLIRFIIMVLEHTVQLFGRGNYEHSRLQFIATFVNLNPSILSFIYSSRHIPTLKTLLANLYFQINSYYDEMHSLCSCGSFIDSEFDFVNISIELVSSDGLDWRMSQAGLRTLIQYLSQFQPKAPIISEQLDSNVEKYDFMNYPGVKLMKRLGIGFSNDLTIVIPEFIIFDTNVYMEMDSCVHIIDNLLEKDRCPLFNIIVPNTVRGEIIHLSRSKHEKKKKNALFVANMFKEYRKLQFLNLPSNPSDAGQSNRSFFNDEMIIKCAKEMQDRFSANFCEHIKKANAALCIETEWKGALFVSNDKTAVKVAADLSGIFSCSFSYFVDVFNLIYA